jgi:hypothetical protein
MVIPRFRTGKPPVTSPRGAQQGCGNASNQSSASRSFVEIVGAPGGVLAPGDFVE